MKIKLFALALFLLTGVNTQAQKKPPVVKATATTHSVTLTWTGAIIGSTTQVWRALCSAALVSGVCPTASEGTFVSLTGGTDVPVNIATYVDATVLAATVYSYFVVIDCVQPACGVVPGSAGILYNGSSAPSVHIGAAVPTVPPPPTLQLGPIAVNKSGTCCVTVATTWTDMNYPSTTFMLFNQNGILISGYRKAANFALNWKGLPFQIVTASLAVCDLQTCTFVPIPPIT